jgi:hypothetical protein
MSGQSLDDVRKKIQLIITPDKVHNDTTGYSQLPKLTIECDDHSKAYDFPEGKRERVLYASFFAYINGIDISQRILSLSIICS